MKTFSAIIGSLVLSGIVAVSAIGQDRRISVKPPNDSIPVVSPKEDPAQRLALVIGINDYPREEKRLYNAVNDARLMADTLRKADFEVELIENGTQSTILNALETLKVGLRKGGTGLVYFSGHGIQVYGTSHLLPSDIYEDEDTGKLMGTISLGDTISQMQQAGNNLNMVILDACRDVPESFLVNQRRGLSDVENHKNIFIGYSTSPGKTADDGDGSNSPYTSYLSHFMLTPGLTLEDVFKETSKAVKLQTEKKGKPQTPYVAQSFAGDFVFIPAHIDPEELTVRGGNMDEEDKWFQYIRIIGTLLDIAAFLDVYPGSSYRDELESLARDQSLCSMLSFLQQYPKNRLSEVLRSRAKELLEESEIEIDEAAQNSSVTSMPVINSFRIAN